VRSRYYLAVDVGGTNIQTALVKSSGRVIARGKTTSPRSGGPEPILQKIEQAIESILDEESLPPAVESVLAIGIAIPGVVNPEKGEIIVTPNMELSGVALAERLESKFRVPVALGNDCNLGTLGEKWLGSARNAESVVGMLVGTGIGGGIVFGSKLWRGARESASEIGHTVIEVGGPECGCGNHGCLEAIASRTAIERDIRQAVQDGRDTILTELTGDDLSIIRSSMLRGALEAGDELTTEVVSHAAEMIGYACLNIRHLIDPEVIVLGGGVIEACSQFIMPIVEQIIESDSLTGASDNSHIVVATLGDDAVLLGAVAVARLHLGKNPFKQKSKSNGYTDLPKVHIEQSGVYRVKQKKFEKSFYVTVNGKTKRLKTQPVEGQLEIEHLAKACRGGPELLLIGTNAMATYLSENSENFLRYRTIQHKLLSSDEAIEAFNGGDSRRALLILQK
jgi:glucokinase